MRLLRWLATALVALALLVAAVAVGARFADGPVGPLPGGAFRSGEWVDVLRIDGKRYPVTLTRIETEPALADALRAEVNRKYGQPPPTSAGVWIFRVSSRPRSG